MTTAIRARVITDDDTTRTSGLAQLLTALPRVARALARTTAGLADPITALTRRLDLTTYRAILAYPWWTLIRQAMVNTRSYEQGLAAGVQLLGHTEAYRDSLPVREIEQHVITLGGFMLEMLDRLDDWEAYLDVWHLLRTHTACGLTYNRAAAVSHGRRMTPFILGHHPGYLRVHFLYLTLHRKAVIERKLDRQRRGAKLGNCWHVTQDELSDAEIRERLEAVAQLAQEVAQQH